MISVRGAVRRRVHEILETSRPGDATSTLVDALLAALVVANVVAVVLESVRPVYRTWGAWFDAFEALSVAIFSAEYALRAWSAAESDGPAGEGAWRKRLRYLVSPLALTDLCAVLPYYLSAFVAVDLRFLRILRMLRIFKLTRYSGAMRMLLETFAREGRAFGAAVFILLAVTVLASGGIYLAEHRAQPEAFGSIPAAMWWALVTLTTVGYGDVVPVTPFGKLFAACVTIVGVGMVALPTGILASGFAEVHRRHRRTLEREAERALEDGVVTAEEASSFAALADQLGVSPQVADEIAALAQRGVFFDDGEGPCPHCGKPRA
ncbi:MAG: ion transporter [Myxococcota bacterium]|nr:ion transporter [Myxococcota bacterium]